MSLKRQRESENGPDDLESMQPENKVHIVPGNESYDAKSKDKKKSNNKSVNKSNNKNILEKNITCSLPPLCSQNPKDFDNFADYQLHYLSDHTNICAECSKNFPTSKLLDLHINENHNPFIKIKLQKEEPVFGCFVENCDKLFKNHKKRRLHLIDKHDYPKNFIFSIVDRGIKKTDTSLIKQDAKKSYGVWKPA